MFPPRVSIASIFFCCSVFLCCTCLKTFKAPDDNCTLPAAVVKEIHSMKSQVKYTIDRILDEWKGVSYKDLADWVDTFGGRLAGSQNYEKSLDYLIDVMRNKQLSPWTESFEIPHWTRGNESAEIVSPSRRKIKIVGLGYSGSTFPEGLTANVVVVSNFSELDALGTKVKNKIVLFNANFTSYHETVIYRSQGPARASKLGAVAALIRSITPFSIYSPHTGMTEFGECDTVIPAAAVTLEDADYMARIYKKGKNLQVWLKMDASLVGTTTARNIIFDLPGNYSDMVIVSAHTDSWDNGRGAIDNGVNVFLTMYAISALSTFTNARRVIRGILWGAEEFGLLGAKAYKKKHYREIPYWNVAIEADAGSYNPIGFNVEGNHDAYCVVKEIGTLFKDYEADKVKNKKGVGSDITVFKNYSIPLLEPGYGKNNYFWFHHTAGDTMTVLDSATMDKNLAVTSAMVYVLSDLSFRLPRGNESIWDVYRNS